jgi:hypothetical protein
LGLEISDERIKANQGYDFLGDFVKEKVAKNEKLNFDEILTLMKNKQEPTGEFLLAAILEVEQEMLLAKGKSLDFSDLVPISYIYALLRKCLQGSFSLGIEGINEKRIGESTLQKVKHKSFPKDLRDRILNSGVGGLYTPSRIRPDKDYGMQSHQEYEVTPLINYPTQKLAQADISFLERNAIKYSTDPENQTEFEAPYCYNPEIMEELKEKLKNLYRSI